MPLYQVTTIGGKITALQSFKDTIIQWGLPTDPADPHRYTDPRKLLQLDPTTNTFSDPDKALIENQIPSNNVSFLDGRVYGKTANLGFHMSYDSVGDQLVGLWASTPSQPTPQSFHYSIATDTWSIYTNSTAIAYNFENSRHAIIPSDRVLFFVTVPGTNNVYSGSDPTTDLLQSKGWVYQLDTHVVTRVVTFETTITPVPPWSTYAGLANYLQGANGFESMQLMYDATNSIMWWPEIENPTVNQWGYGASGRVIALHAWHYQENRTEKIVPAWPDANNQPHGLAWGFDPVNNYIMCFGQNSNTSPQFGSPATGPDTVTLYPHIYLWQPSGFTKPTWGAMS
jgi:hypothetical protein